MLLKYKDDDAASRKEFIKYAISTHKCLLEKLLKDEI